MADVERARYALRRAAEYVCPECGGHGCDQYDADLPCQYCGGRTDLRLEYADLRGRDIPELPEAACREGTAFLATQRDRDGREKVVLQAAGPDLVRRFLAGEIVPGLIDYYGDPERGFAGGYVRPPVGP
jgi:hypothetical protein